MKYCTECATSIEPEDQFCPECGTRLAKFRIGKAACKHCGSLLVKAGKSNRCPRCDAFCVDCGALIKKKTRTCPDCKISFTKKRNKRSLPHPGAGSSSWVQYAGLLPRGIATLADLIIVATIVVLLGVILGQRLPLFFGWVLLFHIPYSAYFIGTKGSTLGMRMYSLRTVDRGGKHIGKQKAFYRHMISIASGLSIVGGIMIGFHRHHQAMHDLAMDTFVIRIRE